MSKKIKNILPIILKNCFSENFQERWRWPKRDPETGLFKDKYFGSTKMPKLEYEDAGIDAGALDRNKLVLDFDKGGGRTIFEFT